MNAANLEVTLRNADYTTDGPSKITETTYEAKWYSLNFRGTLRFTMDTPHEGRPVYKVEGNGEGVYLGDGYGETPEQALAGLCRRKYMATNVGTILGLSV